MTGSGSTLTETWCDMGQSQLFGVPSQSDPSLLEKENTVAKSDPGCSAYCIEIVIGGRLFCSAWYYGTSEQIEEEERNYARVFGAVKENVKVTVRR